MHDVRASQDGVGQKANQRALCGDQFSIRHKEELGRRRVVKEREQEEWAGHGSLNRVPCVRVTNESADVGFQVGKFS